jgi:hypothetical protein
MKQRRDIVTDGVVKFAKIKDIIVKNPNKKIIIVSQRGEYANKVTQYLKSEGIKCLDYHDCIDDKIDTDEYGNEILIKSGKEKGKVKIIGAQAQSTKNLIKYNTNQCNILSIKSHSNTKLKAACDIMIITSCLCDNIYDIKKRFKDLSFLSMPNKVYRIYFKQTIEDVRKMNWKPLSIHTLILDEPDGEITYDASSGDVIL